MSRESGELAKGFEYPREKRRKWIREVSVSDPTVVFTLTALHSTLLDSDPVTAKEFLILMRLAAENYDESTFSRVNPYFETKSRLMSRVSRVEAIAARSQGLANKAIEKFSESFNLFDQSVNQRTKYGLGALSRIDTNIVGYDVPGIRGIYADDLASAYLLAKNKTENEKWKLVAYKQFAQSKVSKLRFRGLQKQLASMDRATAIDRLSSFLDSLKSHEEGATFKLNNPKREYNTYIEAAGLLAQTLASSGRIEESISHLKDISTFAAEQGDLIQEVRALVISCEIALDSKRVDLARSVFSLAESAVKKLTVDSLNKDVNEKLTNMSVRVAFLRVAIRMSELQEGDSFLDERIKLQSEAAELLAQRLNLGLSPAQAWAGTSKNVKSRAEAIRATDDITFGLITNLSERYHRKASRDDLSRMIRTAEIRKGRLSYQKISQGARWRLAAVLTDQGKPSTSAEKRSRLLYENRIRAIVGNDYISLDQLADVLSDHEVLVQYVASDNHLHVMVVSRNAANHVIVPIDRTKLFKSVSDFKKAIIEEAEAACGNGPLSLEQATRKRCQLGWNLYQLLITPISKYLEDKTRVVLVPDQELFQLPFEALSPSVEGKKFLIENYNIVYSPSSSIYAALVEFAGRERQKPKRILSLGVSGPVKLESSQLALDNEKRAQLPSNLWVVPLDSVEEEVSRVKAIEGCENLTLMNSDATLNSFSRLYHEDFDVMHFACHAVNANLGYGPEPALVLFGNPGNNLLPAFSFSSLACNAHLVVFSACSTAEGRSLDGEGVFSFSRAGLESGNENVLTTLWVVSDSTAAEMASRVIESTFNGNDPASALRQAKLHLMTTTVPLSSGLSGRDLIGSVPSKVHLQDSEQKTVSGRLPYIWASFVLYGTGKGVKYVDDDMADQLGSKSTPVRCFESFGEKRYIARLRCKEKTPFSIVSRVSVGKGPYGYIIDRYHIKCGCGKHDKYVHMDPHFPRAVETRPLPNTTLVREKPDSQFRSKD